MPHNIVDVLLASFHLVVALRTMVAPWGQRAPSCFAECCDPDAGCLDPTKHCQCRRAQKQHIQKNDWLKIIAALDLLVKEEAAASRDAALPPEHLSGSKRKKTRQPKEVRTCSDPVDGSVREFIQLEHFGERALAGDEQVDAAHCI